ncbi:DNA-directed RNA polymerase subunit omega [Acrasis kona]|uniref:DNA-directed RNA polymerase subunit omega n=1 Tax=Acrasis kona TaxID=1008807 RepID=A0AAW2ZF24_9EUKA
METTNLLDKNKMIVNRIQIVWNVVNTALILIVMIMAIVAVSRTKTTHYTQATISLPTNELLKQGDIVSIAQDGKLQKGAGISIYRNTNRFATSDKIKHLHSIYMGNGVTVLCYYSTYAILLPGKLDSETLKIKWQKPVSLESKQMTCDAMERLGNSTNVVIIGGNKAMPVTVNEHDSLITFQLGQVTQHTQGFSIDPRIAVLSNKHVAISFYHTENENTTLNAAVFELENSNENAILVIKSKEIYSLNHASHQIMKFSESEFVLCHPLDDIPTVESGPLSCILATFKYNTIQFSAPVTLDGVKLNFFFDMALLSPNRGVVVFTDTAIDNGIKGVVLELLTTKSGEKRLDFGSTIIINSGHGGGKLPSNLWVYINVEVVSQDRFIAVYSDLSNEGRITCLLVEVSNSASLNLISPEFVISPPNPNFSQYYWIDVSIVDQSMFMIFDSLSEQNGGVVAIGEMKSSVLGIVVFGDKNSAVVQMEGRVSVPNAHLTVGRTYFTTSRGRMHEGAFYGDISELDPENYLKVGSTVISDSSRIGVAVSSSELLLK